MKKFFSCLLVASLFLIMTSCGKKGAIYPPIIRKPQRIENFRAVQRGDRILLEWTNPTTYTDGESLDGVEEVEIWLFEEEKEKEKSEGEESEKEEAPDTEEQISEEEFLQKAALYLALEKEKFPEYLIKKNEESQFYQYQYQLEQKDFLSRKYIFGLRTEDRKKRKSNFSRLLTISPQALPLPPQNINFEIKEDRILILWNAPVKNIDQSLPAHVMGYNVFRAEGEAPPRCLNSDLIKEEMYNDIDFVFGKTYRYFVRASATETPPYLQSSDSEVIEVEAKDTFPPKAPTGLVAIKGEDFISLAWDRNQEKDLAGYRVWRQETGQEEYSLLTPDPIRENTYTDKEIEKNKSYLYTITALDRAGNESEMSQSISEIIGEDVP